MLTHSVNVDGAQIHVVETIPHEPSTSPTVVLVPGLGGTSLGWCVVQRTLPPNLRTFTYDRLGLGQSDRTALPRPAAALARELRDTLVACSVPPPYLLVASSYAGIICREFLEAFDSEVAGLVYVDANQERTQELRRWPLEATQRIAPKGFNPDGATGLQDGRRCTDAEWAEMLEAERAKEAERLAGTDTVHGEWVEYESSLRALGKHGQLDRQALGTRPFSVIVANLTRDFERVFADGKARGRGTAEDHAAVDDFCARLPAVEMQLSVDVLRLSRVHRLVYTSIAGHVVSLWEPELCVQEIMWCLQHLAQG